MRGGVNPGEHHFRSRCVGVVEKRRNLLPGHGALSSTGGADSTRSSQSAIGERDWGFHIVRGGAIPEDSRFHPWGVGVVVIRTDFWTGDGPYHPRVALALHAPANQRSARGIGVSIPCGAVLTREQSIFVPGVSEL